MEKEMTRFERARIIGARALQINRGAPVLIKTKQTDSVKIAEEEFEQGVIPMDVKRRFPPKMESP